MNYSNIYQSINEVMSASAAQVASGKKAIQSPSHMGFKTPGVKTTWQQRGEQGQNRRRQELKNLVKGMGVDALGDTTHRNPEDRGTERSQDPADDDSDYRPPGPGGWWTAPNSPLGFEKPSRRFPNGRPVFRPKPYPPGPGQPKLPPGKLPPGFPPRPGKVIPIKPSMLPWKTPKPPPGVMVKILGLIATGMSLAGIAAMLGISLATLMIWLGISNPGINPVSPENTPPNLIPQRYPSSNPLDDPTLPGIQPRKEPVSEV